MREAVLELKGVCKKYAIADQEFYALCGLNLTIYKGEFVSIIGPSGSGKSTFLHMASLLDSPSEGTVLLLGKDVSSYSEPERAKLRNAEIGFIFQQFNLLAKTSAQENVALPLLYAGVDQDERNSRAAKLLTKVGLGDRLSNTPAQLSGGQQQRVAVARALINDPAIIFADEPTGNLDSKSGKEIKQMIIDLHDEGRTIVMVTHDPEMAKIGSRIVKIEDGKVVSDIQNKGGK